MAKPRQSEFAFSPRQLYSGPDIPMRVIRRYARAIAEEFRPDKIILFGSFAYGTPHVDSDVDILVIMPARNQGSQAYKIRLALSAPFAMDLIVRTPDTMKWRLQEGDSFLREIVSRGKILYEKADGRVGAKSRRGLPGSRQNSSRSRPIS
jgi:predicted nucleotidyltransferase